MKTPINYYAGKQNMLKHILPLIPEHKIYVEPFCGGAAVLFAKPKSELEIINDLNGFVSNFYQVLKNDFGILRYLIESTPHSRKAHRESEYVLKHSDCFSTIKVARAFWVQTNMSFGGKMYSGYAYEKLSNKTVKRTQNKKNAFNKQLFNRISLVDIESNDAIKVIKSRDSENAFFYVDPPIIIVIVVTTRVTVWMILRLYYQF